LPAVCDWGRDSESDANHLAEHSAVAVEKGLGKLSGFVEYLVGMCVCARRMAIGISLSRYLADFLVTQIGKDNLDVSASNVNAEGQPRVAAQPDQFRRPTGSAGIVYAGRRKQAMSGQLVQGC
jgi:hypothetical protein